MSSILQNVINYKDIVLLLDPHGMVYEIILMGDAMSILFAYAKIISYILKILYYLMVSTQDFDTYCISEQQRFRRV